MKLIRTVLPNLCIAMTLALVTLLILDSFNPLLGLLRGGIGKDRVLQHERKRHGAQKQKRKQHPIQTGGRRRRSFSSRHGQPPLFLSICIVMIVVPK